MAKRVYDAELIVGWGRGRPTRLWVDGLTDSLSSRGLTLEQAKVTHLNILNN